VAFWDPPSGSKKQRKLECKVAYILNIIQQMKI